MSRRKMSKKNSLSTTLSPTEKCVRRLRNQYPLYDEFDDFAYFDGNSVACRLSYTASMEDGTPSEALSYCPHISFAPDKDGNGNKPCTASAQAVPLPGDEFADLACAFGFGDDGYIAEYG